jgi:DNA-binding transcriptional LysR family regulator
VRGRLRVNIDPYFSRLVLGPRLGQFVEDHPNLTLDLVTRDTLGDMVADGFDVAFRFGHPRNSTLVARKLMDVHVVTLAAPSYLKRHGWPHVPADLESPTTPASISAIGNRTAISVGILAKRRAPDRPGARPPGGQRGGTMHGVCMAGHGICQTFEYGAESLIAEGRLVKVLTDWGDETFPLYALYPSRQHLPAKVRAFVDFVVGICNERSA